MSDNIDLNRTGLSKFLFNMSMRSRCFIIQLPIIILALLACIGVSEYYLYQSVGNTLKMMLSDSSERLGMRVTTFMESACDNAVDDAEWISVTKETLNGSSLNGIAKRNGFARIVVVDENGRGSDGADYTGDKSFQIFRGDKQAKNYISPLLLNKKTNAHELLFSAPIKKHEAFGGALLCYKNAGDLVDLLDTSAANKSVETMVIDKDGNVLASSRKSLLYRSKSYFEKQAVKDASLNNLVNFFDDLTRNNKGFFPYTLNGERRLAAYSLIKGTPGWRLGLGYSENRAYENAHRASVYIMVLSIIFLLIVVVSYYWLISFYTKRMTKVTCRLEKLADGDLTSPLEGKLANDEIGVMTDVTERLINEFSKIINEIKLVLGGLAKGDLSIKTETQFVGEFGKIRTALDENVEMLKQLILKITQAAEEVARGSAQMASGAAALSQGASEQAGSVEELYATVSDVTNRASEIAAPNKTDEEDSEDDITLTAEQLTERKEAAAKTLSDKLVASMERIANTSTLIQKMALAGENIASETHILALNASVEAAHAGEAGKGFGVIADEVRNLSSSTKESASMAHEQTELISKAVDRGNQMVKRTVDEISAIVASLDQIKSALSQISNVIESTAATAEETAAASEELSAQATMLKETVSQFKFNWNKESNREMK